MRPRLDSRRPFRPLLEALETRTLLSVCTVDRLTDVGEGNDFVGDLRYCLAQAQNNDSIQFAVAGTINLTRALPNVTRSVSIDGPGPDLLTVRRDTGGDYRIFTVSSSATVSISGLTASDGFGSDGGGGIFNSGTLTINNSTISSNSAGDGGGGIFNRGTLRVVNSTVSDNRNDLGFVGGGIFNSGTLMISNSTISGNIADIQGGGINNEISGMLTITNSTISGNFAGSQGGGIWNSGMLTITNSSISNNRSGAGGGIFNFRTLHLRNTIVAGNTALTNPDLVGSLTSSGYNLIGNSSGGSGYDFKTDLLNVDSLLGPLADNGGPTLTHALLKGSPALDTGDNTDAPEWDQRGEGFSRIVGKNIDIGAYEEQGEGGGPSPGNPIFDAAALFALLLSQPARQRP